MTDFCDALYVYILPLTKNVEISAYPRPYNSIGLAGHSCVHRECSMCARSRPGTSCTHTRENSLHTETHIISLCAVTQLQIDYAE